MRPSYNWCSLYLKINYMQQRKQFAIFKFLTDNERAHNKVERERLFATIEAPYADLNQHHKNPP
jgi:hypothetical protein